ncbi:MAG: efflux RND transporter permease subunit [Deltaproteobacteria bacterium]|nr:efflux RND transporter permease subunit [Deltaproteobacteria bacterium]
MTISDLSIRRPVFAWMLMLGLIVFGGIGFTRLGISQLPDVDFPMVTVVVTLEGAAPEVMETEVADVIEDAVMTIAGVKEISSVSRHGSASVSVEFELGRDIDVAVQEVQNKLFQAQRELPREADPPTIMKTNPEDHPIMWLALSGERPLKELMDYTHDTLQDQFSTVPGVGEVFLGGYVAPSLRIWLDADRLHAQQLTAQDVIQAVQTEHTEVPSGLIDTGERELNVRVLGEAATPEEFQRIIIPQRSGAPIWRRLTIGDVGRVEDGLNDVRRISRHLGKPAIGLGIKKQRGANAVDVARAVKARVATLQSSLPAGLEFRVVFDSSRFIEEATRELNFTLLLSVFMTALVCWFFLGSWTSTLNILLAIPTAIVGSFLILYFSGFTLNTFTLLGLTLAVGIVVDDAIMVLENIVRYQEQGMSRVRAALVGAREITFAAVAASIAILAIFLPVVFMKGMIGAFFYQFGVTMSVAVLLSLLEALTLTPMRCSQYVSAQHTTRVGRTIERTMQRLARAYGRGLRAALRHRWKVILGCLLLFVGSLQLATLLKKEFVPPQDQSRFLVMVQTPIGSSLQVTDAVTKQVEAYLMHRPEVQYYYAAIGGFGGGEVSTAMLFVTLKPPRERPIVPPAKAPLSQQALMPIIRKDLQGTPGISHLIIQDLSLSGFGAQRGFPVEFTVRGPEWEQLATVSQQLMTRMRTTELMTDVDSDYLLGMPEVHVVPDRYQAAARGVSMATIGNTINAMIGGVRVGKFTQRGRRYDIRLRLGENDRQDPQDIRKILVRNNRGELIPLADVVRLEERSTLRSISRRNRERAISVFANVAPGHGQSEVLAAVAQLATETLPEGYRLVWSGSAQTFHESFQSLMVALVLGVFVAYMVLASQFNSFIHPFTVLLSLPFSVTGAFVALLLAGRSLNLYSMIGIILLMGIVKKNAILLVDFTNERRQRGMAPHDALLEACPIRLRPILMTSCSTIAAAIPPALGFGPGAEARTPMALVVIGGVLFSTVLTLFVVPCAYSLLARFESHRHDQALREAEADLPVR